MPTAVAGLANAQRIVIRLDELASLYAAGDGDATGQWGNDEGTWVASNMRDLLYVPALSDYTTNVIALVSAVAAGADQTDAVETLIGTRSDIAATFGLAAALPTATPEPTEVAHRVGDRVAFTVTGDESNALWLTVVRAIAPWKSSNQFVTPDAGNKFLIAEVLFQGKSGEVDAQANEFSINDANGYVYDIAAMWKETSLPYDFTLKVGKKVRGWLTFEVPKGLKKGWIVYADTQFAFTVK